MKDVTPIGASSSAQLGSKAAAVISSIPNDDIAVEGSRVPLMKSLRTRPAPLEMRQRGTESPLFNAEGANTCL